MHRLILPPLLLLLGACSSPIPELIRTPPEGNPPLALVRAEPEQHLGARIRWGGTITKVQNREAETRIEIVARDLAGDGEPRNIDYSEGRFIALFPLFLDPAIYAEGRNLTVLGTVQGSSEEQLGSMRYRYPLVKVEAHYLWPKPIPRCETCDPRFYDPFYDPWYPWRPYPWHRYPYW
jgi:outer membrane lipoprotein